MPYDKKIEALLDDATSRWRTCEKKKMFGGVCYFVRGNICVGIWKSNLIVRCGPTRYEKELAKPGVKEFNITGRSMKGWVMVPRRHIDTDGLEYWLKVARRFVAGLPAK